jgi:hypothetical protein
MRPAAGEHLAALFGGHALAKAVATLADESARLVGALHDGDLTKNGPKEPCF